MCIHTCKEREEYACLLGFVHVCQHTFLCFGVSKYVCTDVLYACMYLCKDFRMYVCKDVPMYICVYIYICTNVRIHVFWIYICTHACPVCMHVYMHIQLHAFIQI
jgi:hypothetical protein